MDVILMIILAAASAGMIYSAHRLALRRNGYINEAQRFASANRRFEGTVTGTSKEKPRAVILRFRDEEQKKTIVHRYMFSHRRYKNGTAVTLYYDEAADTVCVEGDNHFVHMAKRCTVSAVLCVTAAVVMLSIGIVNLIL